jgi:predicted RNA binding protein YcfA (HicA-like mRNA interferase family)
MKRGSMKRKKSGPRALVAYLCHFRPEPEGGFTVTLPQAAPGRYLWRNPGSAGERARGDRAVLRGDAGRWPAHSTPRPRSRLADRSAGAGCRRGRMRALPALSGRAVIAALERAGVEVIRTKGSHHFLRHSDDHSWQTVVPVHRNDLPPGTLRAILLQARLSRAQFLELL